MFFFFNDTATTEIYTLSLHDALPISTATTTSSPTCCATSSRSRTPASPRRCTAPPRSGIARRATWIARSATRSRSEEHTSELQSRQYLVCRLLLEKKKIKYDLTALCD